MRNLVFKAIPGVVSYFIIVFQLPHVSQKIMEVSNSGLKTPELIGIQMIQFLPLIALIVVVNIGIHIVSIMMWPEKGAARN